MANELKSVRMTQECKRRFIQRVVAQAFPNDKEPTLPQYDEEQADKIMEAAQLDVKPALDKYPKWVKTPKTSNLVVKMGSHGTLNLDLSKEYPWFVTESSWSISSNFIYELTDNDPLVKKFASATKQLEDWRIRRKELERTITALINPLNTTRQLFRAWPDAIQYKDIFPIPEPSSKQKRTQATTKVSADEVELALSMAKVTFKDE